MVADRRHAPVDDQRPAAAWVWVLAAGPWALAAGAAVALERHRGRAAGARSAGRTAVVAPRTGTPARAARVATAAARAAWASAAVAREAARRPVARVQTGKPTPPRRPPRGGRRPRDRPAPADRWLGPGARSARRPSRDARPARGHARSSARAPRARASRLRSRWHAPPIRARRDPLRRSVLRKHMKPPNRGGSTQEHDPC